MKGVYQELNLVSHQGLSQNYEVRCKGRYHRMETNRVELGDASTELKSLPSETVDLIYLDPPFFTNREFEAQSRERLGTQCGFSDKWPSGLASYLEFMEKVLQECRRILRQTGSIYVHCDWHASHYLKVELDKIFGYNNFRNEIVWKRHNAHNDTKQGSKLFGRIHDVILFYSTSSRYTWNPVYQPYPQHYIDKYYRHLEAQSGRRYALGDLSGPGRAMKGNPYYSFLGVKQYWRYSKKRIRELYHEDRIVQTRRGTVPKLKRYLDEMHGIILQDVWDDVLSPQVTRLESVGYPTQKPIRLLERIIEVSTRPGDLVLDPMCGSGTTLVAADHLGRKWIGMDVNRNACDISRKRLKGMNCVTKLPAR